MRRIKLWIRWKIFRFKKRNQIKKLKQCDVWDKLDMFYCDNESQSDFSTINWKNPDSLDDAKEIHFNKK